MNDDERRAEHCNGVQTWPRPVHAMVGVPTSIEDDDTAKRPAPMPVSDPVARQYLAALERSVAPRFDDAEVGSDVQTRLSGAEKLLRIVFERLDAVDDLEARVADLEQRGRSSARVAADALEVSERRLVELAQRLDALEARRS